MKTSVCIRILIPKDRLAVFTHYPSVTRIRLHTCGSAAFKPVNVTVKDTIACYNVVKG